MLYRTSLNPSSTAVPEVAAEFVTRARAFVPIGESPEGSCRHSRKRGSMAYAYELRCRECGKRYDNAPLSICDECFSPLEVVCDLDAAKKSFTREAIAAGPASMWRYQALLPVPENYKPTTPAGWTPLLRAPRLAERIGAKNLWIKN